MKRWSKLVAILVACALACFSFAACSSSDTTSADDASSPQEEASDTRVVLDSNGAEVTIPSDVERVAAGLPAYAQVTAMLTGDQSKIVCTRSVVSDFFKEVFPSYTESNPDDLDTQNIEDLIGSGAQVLFGPANFYSDEDFEKIETAGISFVEITQFKTYQEMMDYVVLIGDILGEDEAARAADFNEHAAAVRDDVEKRTANVSDDEKPRVLILTASGGAYSTANSTDVFSDLVDMAGGVNVAADYAVEGESGASLPVDAEQIIAWNPDIIIARLPDTYDAVMNDPSLSALSAVQNGAVVKCPQGLFSWCTRSAENVMALEWLGQLLYPDLFEDVDMREVVSDYFATWYGYDINEEQIDKVFEGTLA